MGKTGKWIRNLLIGKKEKEKEKEKEKNGNNQQLSIVVRGHPTTPILIPSTTPKEKKRWSFRRSSAAAPGQKDSSSADVNGVAPLLVFEDDQKKHALAMAAATAAAADAAVAAAKAAAAVIQLSAAAAASSSGRASAIEEAAAATKIQSHYRAYLARKALNALRGLVKLQALVRGHLVRKQAAATLRCMQALVTVQARARAQRIRTVEEPKSNYQRQFNHRKSSHDSRSRHSYQDFDRAMEEDIKIVEMDLGDSKGSIKSRSSYSNHGQTDRFEHRISTHHTSPKQEYQQISPSPSAITDLSPKAHSGHFEEYSIGTAQSSPYYLSAISKPDPSNIPFDYPQSEYADSLYSEYPFYPSYMANTQSSRAKVRSHSAPKQRPESFERQPSVGRRRPSIEGRNVPRGMKMQRSSSHVGSAAQNYQYPWSLKLDRSAVSLIESECGSTSTVLTNANYCRSLVGFEVHGNRY